MQYLGSLYFTGPALIFPIVPTTNIANLSLQTLKPRLILLIVMFSARRSSSPNCWNRVDSQETSDSQRLQGASRFLDTEDLWCSSQDRYTVETRSAGQAGKDRFSSSTSKSGFCAYFSDMFTNYFS